MENLANKHKSKRYNPLQGPNPIKSLGFEVGFGLLFNKDEVNLKDKRGGMIYNPPFILRLYINSLKKLISSPLLFFLPSVNSAHQ